MSQEVPCRVERVDDAEDENGQPTEGVRVTCGECGEEADSPGSGPKAIARCLANLRRNCELGDGRIYRVKRVSDGD